MINLSDLGKPEKKSNAPASPDSNLLLTTQYDLDSFNISPQKIKQGGMNTNINMMNMNMNPLNPNLMGMNQMGINPNMMNMNPNAGMMGMNPNMMNPNYMNMNMGMMYQPNMYMGNMGQFSFL